MAFSAIVSLQKDLFLKVNVTLSDSVVYNPKEVILYEIYHLKSIKFKFSYLPSFIYRMPTVCSAFCQVL